MPNPLERARTIKVPNEIKMIRSSLRAVETGVRKLEAAIRPGATENEDGRIGTRTSLR